MASSFGQFPANFRFSAALREALPPPQFALIPQSGCKTKMDDILSRCVNMIKVLLYVCCMFCKILLKMCTFTYIEYLPSIPGCTRQRLNICETSRVLF